MRHPVSQHIALQSSGSAVLADVSLTGDQGPQGSRFPASAHFPFLADTEDLTMEIRAAEMRCGSKHRL